MSKWVKVVASKDNEDKSVVGHLKKSIFSHFCTLFTNISDGASHFCKKVLRDTLSKCGVKQHKVDTPYHPKPVGK